MIEPWDKVFYFQLKSQRHKIKFCAPIIRSCDRIEQDLANGVGFKLTAMAIGYLRYPSVQRRATRAKGGAGNEIFCREGTIKTSTGIPQVEDKRVWPEVAPAFPLLENQPEVLTEPVPFETVKQADPTLAIVANQGADCWSNGEESYWRNDGRWTRSSQSSWKQRSLKNQFHKFCCWTKKMSL